MSGSNPKVLLYHQISDQETKFLENYNISVTPTIFEEHMKIISDNFKPISFEEWNYAKEIKEDISDRIIVTFDDGYIDSIRYGSEILKKYNIDAIWFINGDFINNKKVFWLSQLMFLYNSSKLNIFLDEFKENHGYLFSPINLNNCKVDELDQWAKENYSKTLAESLNNFIKKIDWNEENEAGKNAIFATPEVIRDLSKNFTIGNHTLTHPNFRNLSIEDKVYEAEESRTMIEKITGAKIDCFAFPFGQEHFHWCQNDVKIIENLGYNYIFSVFNEEERLNKKAIFRYDIPSIGGSEFKSLINSIMQ